MLWLLLIAWILYMYVKISFEVEIFVDFIDSPYFSSDIQNIVKISPTKRIHFETFVQ